MTAKPTDSSDSGLRKPPRKETDVGTLVREWAGATIGIMVVLGAFAAFVLAQSRAYAEEAVQVARADAGAAAMRATTAQVDLAAHVAEERQARGEMRADMSEIQRDIRELYRVVRDGRRSERLETPIAADGGQ